MDPGKAPQIQLKSYPNGKLELPLGAQTLIPKEAPAKAIPRELSLAKLRNHLLPLLTEDQANGTQSAIRVLLLLPDKTRKQTAARLLIDAMIELCQSVQTLSFDIIFGLGTHPLMSAGDITTMLGPQRLERLAGLGTTLQQQTTLKPLAQRHISIPPPPKILDGTAATAAPKQPTTCQDNGESGRSEGTRVGLPAALWQYDYIISGGDTDLHPYEGRAGSGGINKMLVVGIGCLNCVRITHTMEVLSHALTRPGEANNHFVKLLDYFTKEILAQLRGGSSRLKANPIGVSVLARKTDQPDYIWVGDQDKNRSVLTKQLEEERTVALNQPVSFVIIDTERRKATDILAGARSLHFLCSFDDPSNQLLRSRPACRSALMFNACHEAKNSNGIGNAGTLLHLNALRSFVHESITEARDSGLIEGNNGLSDNKRRNIKEAVLARWKNYLQLVSNEDDFFARVESLLIGIISANNNIQDKAPLLDELVRSLDDSFAHSFGNHRHVITGTRHHFAHSGARDALLFLQQSTNAIGFKGLGEGGQRALRLLVILQKFDTLYIATDNQHVLQFLAELNHPPGISNIDQPPGRSLIGAEPNILGLTGISLNDHSPQAALQLALDQHQDQTIPFNGSELAFIQEPVIIKREPSQEFKTAATPLTTIALDATRMYS
jgi:hypothetical protein